MTDDYKESMLDYIANTITSTSPTTKEIFSYQTDIDRSLWVDYLPEHWNNFRYEGMIAPNETTTGLGVLYGGYIDTDNNVCGIITLFNDNFVPVKTIYEFSSGTKLKYIQYMKQAEDGTFYFIDDEAFTYSQASTVKTSAKRFVMTNNFTTYNTVTSDYTITLRTSYNLSGDYLNFYCKNMFKDANSSHYIFFGDAVDEGNQYRYLKIFGLKVNVGSENEWTMYTSLDDYLFGSAFATFDSDSNVMFRCLNTKVDLTDNSVYCNSKTYTGTATNNVIATFNYSPYIDDDGYKKQSVFMTIDLVYFVVNNQRWGVSTLADVKHLALYKYDFSTSTLKKIYDKNLGKMVYGNIEAMYIDKNNTDLYIQFNNNIDTTNDTADYYFQRLVNDTWKPILIGQAKKFLYYRRTLFIKSNFNLLQVYLYSASPYSAYWYCHLIKEDYNALNYNGEAYDSYNSTIPKKVEIYDDTSLIFARNLYNLTLNENQSEATYVVPNSYLNGIDLKQQNELSQTNKVIVKNADTITKNIYETLYLNYINSINVVDTDINKSYPSTANYITTNINTGTQTNFTNTYIGKARVNTSSNSTIIAITWTKLNKYTRQTTFTISVTEEITSIDLISNDETTTYMSIDGTSLEVGKTYTISQKVGVEYVSGNVLYDNQQVQYNGNDIIF